MAKSNKTTKQANTQSVSATTTPSLKLSKLDISNITRSFDVRIINHGGLKIDNNNYLLQATEQEQVSVKFIGQKVLVVGKTIKKSFDMCERAELKLLLDIIENSYYSKGSKKVVPEQEKPAPKPTIEVPTKQATNKKGATTMATTSVNVPKFKESLKKAGYTESKGVFSKGEMNVAFTAKLVKLAKEGKNQTIALATCTDGALAGCIKHLDSKGEIQPHTPIEGLTVPVTTGAPPKADKGKKADDTEREQLPGNKEPEVKKEPPKKPVNPNADGAHPIFDQLAVAVTETDKAEETVVSIWQPLAEKYQFSVSGLIADLHKEGVWPDKMNKDGVPFEVDGYTVPAGYKGVYEAEKEKGLKGAGYMVNRASRMFTKLNPAMSGGAAKDGGKGTPSNEPETVNEKAQNKIMISMSTMAAKLTKENLKAWLDSDKSVLPILNEMLETSQSSTEDLLDSL